MGKYGALWILSIKARTTDVGVTQLDGVVPGSGSDQFPSWPVYTILIKTCFNLGQEGGTGFSLENLRINNTIVFNSSSRISHALCRHEADMQCRNTHAGSTHIE